MDESPLKRCGRCRKDKPLSEFYRSDAKYYSYCKPCHAEYQRDRNAANPLTYLQKIGQRSNRLYRNFGITVIQYMVLGDLQGWLCKICDQELEMFSQDTQVDHCHTTERLRGILCGRCNRALGLMDDNPSRLKLAAKYLETA